MLIYVVVEAPSETVVCVWCITCFKHSPVNESHFRNIPKPFGVCRLGVDEFIERDLFPTLRSRSCYSAYHRHRAFAPRIRGKCVYCLRIKTGCPNSFATKIDESTKRPNTLGCDLKGHTHHGALSDTMVLLPPQMAFLFPVKFRALVMRFPSACHDLWRWHFCGTVFWGALLWSFWVARPSITLSRKCKSSRSFSAHFM